MGAQQSHSIKEEKEEFPTAIHLYYAISRSLRRGCIEEGRQKRPPLPIEVIILIFDLAGFNKPSKENFIDVCDLPCVVRSHGSRVTKIFTYTKPMTRAMLARLKGFQIRTLSHDGGFVGDRKTGNRSRFEVVILTPRLIGDNTDIVGPGESESPLPDYTVKRGPDHFHAELKWLSHHNIMGNPSYTSVNGSIFDEEHQIWSHLEEADIIAVRACTQFGAWENHVQRCKVAFWDRFDPTVLG